MISGSGFFTVGTVLSVGASAADCIDIKASNVSLNTQGNPITGPGVSSTGVGIHILKSANNAIVELATPGMGFRTLVSGFQVGIQDDASNATIDNFDTQGNTRAGVLLNKVSGTTVANFTTIDHLVGVDVENSKTCLITDFSVDNGLGAGMLVNGSQGLDITNFTAGTINGNEVGLQVVNSSGNSIINWNARKNDVGILLGNSNNNIVDGAAIQFPSDTGNASDNTEGIELQKSTGNKVANFIANSNKTFGVFLNASSNNVIGPVFFAFDNGTSGVEVGFGTVIKTGKSNGNHIVDGTCVPHSSPQGIGVHIDPGSTGNSVSFINASGNTTFDALDDNPNCASNRWFDNGFSSVNPVNCIH